MTEKKYKNIQGNVEEAQNKIITSRILTSPKGSNFTFKK